MLIIVHLDFTLKYISYFSLHCAIYKKIILKEKCRLRVFENRIFGPKRDENGEWRRLHNGELLNLYSSHNIVSVIKSRMLRWAGHVARMANLNR